MDLNAKCGWCGKRIDRSSTLGGFCSERCRHGWTAADDEKRWRKESSEQNSRDAKKSAIKREIEKKENDASQKRSARSEKIGNRVGQIGTILLFCLFGYFVAPWFGVPIPITVGFILISSIGIIFVKSP